MAVEYVKGNIIELFNNGDFEILIHGCNCFHTMGRGLALALRDRWPEVYEADLTSTKGDYDKLGTYTIANLLDGREIFNLYSQYYYSKEEVMISYAAIEEGLKSIAMRLKQNDDEDKRIIMPLIGSTNGGADPIFIKQVILSIFGDLNVTVVTSEIKESRDKIHLIQFIPTVNGDVKSGLELFSGTGLLKQWVNHLSHRAAIITSGEDLKGALEPLLSIGKPIIAVGDITFLDDRQCVTRTTGVEHGLMLARDFCVANELDAIFIIGTALYSESLDYCDVVHHVELKQSDRDNPTMDQWDAEFDESDMSQWVNSLYRKISTSYSHVGEHPKIINITDTVYRRIDKKYREQYAI